jgi:hypothetical protein
VKEALDFEIKENHSTIDYGIGNNSDTFSNNSSFENFKTDVLNNTNKFNERPKDNFSSNKSRTGKTISSELVLDDIFGIEFHIPGYTVNQQRYIFVSVFDQYVSSSRQIPIDFDPTTRYTEYTIQLSNSTFSGKNIWNVKFFIDAQQVAEFSGLKFEERGTFGVYNWNENDYVPPIENNDFPIAFETSSFIEIMKDPLPANKPCMFGSSFYENDSYIQEIWVRVSNHENETDSSLEGYSLYSTFCKKCSENCNIGCRQACQSPLKEYDILSFTIKNLNLTTAKMSGDRTNGSAVQYDAETYFIHAIIVNSAGLTTHSVSKGFMIDVTPPVFNYVRCVDPLSSTEEPSLYQGSNDSLRAYWDCNEDVSQIKNYKIDAGTLPGTIFIYLSIYLFIHLSISMYLSVYFVNFFNTPLVYPGVCGRPIL